MSNGQRILAIDIGQTGSRLRSSDGLEFHKGPAFNREAGVISSIRNTLVAAQNPKTDIVSLSLTGLRGFVPDPNEIGKLCHSLTGAEAVAVIDDGFAALSGALDGKDGLAISVGSGVVAVAKNGNAVAHRDGDGPILGDDGGGFWIGREGLRSALKFHEDRGPETILLERVESKFGAIYAGIRNKPDDEIRKLCIQAAEVVLDCANAGDLEAMKIRDSATDLLTETVCSAWRGVSDMDGGGAASYTGRVLSNHEFKSMLLEKMNARVANLKWHEPYGDNLDGALFIGISGQSDLPPLLRWWHL